jgi:hypothetical protein
MAGLSRLSFARLINRSEKAKTTQTQKLVVNHMLPVAHLERTSVILYVAIQWRSHR